MKSDTVEPEMKLTLFFLLFGFCSAKKSVAFETAEVTYFNPEYVSGKLSSNKYNATTFLINAKLNVTKQIPLDTMLAIDIFKLSDNTYKKTALSMKRNICQFLVSSEYKMMSSTYMEERFNIPKKCPLNPGAYEAKDLDPNRMVASELFNFLPLWDIKIEVAITSKNHPILNLRIRFKVIDTY